MGTAPNCDDEIRQLYNSKFMTALQVLSKGDKRTQHFTSVGVPWLRGGWVEKHYEEKR